MLISREYKVNKVEFCYNFAEQVRWLRESNKLSFEEISQGTGIPIINLKRLELGQGKDWGDILQLAKFYEKKIRLEFY